MEFPDLGKHCSEPTCQRLDFLPLKCDACNGIFCHDHMRYDTHNCPSSYKKDVQVPVCPLCSQPVPVGRNQQPDIVKEVVPVVCPECRLNFCLRHRHTQDHKCEGHQAAARNRATAAAAARQSSSGVSAMSAAASAASRLFSKPTTKAVTPVAAIQGTMSEDEALARALQESMLSTNPSVSAAEGNTNMSQEEADRLLALAIAESEREQARRPQQQGAVSSRQSEKSCNVS
ncbi:hypothetical protein B566_EDAN011747 [Ephemera danica]|nr:hypothetical protein B566_EDAN011747 [Ephemera danica]